MTAIAPAPLRRLIPIVGALGLVALYLIWWVNYAAAHLEPRHQQLDPGAAAEVQGTSFRMLTMTRADMVGAAGGGDPAPALPGATWVIAELEAKQREGAEEFYCTFMLVGTNGRQWQSESSGTQRALPSCASAEIKPGGTYRFEAIFQVSVADASGLVGIALEDPSRPTRQQVITPPG